MARAAAHVADAIEYVKGQETTEALEQAGAAVLRGKAQFVSPFALEVAATNGSKTRLLGRKFLLCPGSQPYVPSIRGLRSIKYWTYQDLLQDPPVELPSTLVVLGGGAQALEFAEAFQRLGSQVTAYWQKGPRHLPTETCAHDKRDLCS